MDARDMRKAPDLGGVGTTRAARQPCGGARREVRQPQMVERRNPK
jgi:hypothetical protein